MLKKKGIFGLILTMVATLGLAMPGIASMDLAGRMLDGYMAGVYSSDNVVEHYNIDEKSIISDELSVRLVGMDKNILDVNRDFDGKKFALQIGLPTVGDRLLFQSDKVVYKDDGFNQAVQIAGNDVHVVSTILNEDAKEIFEYKFDLPSGAYMEYADFGKDNSVLIYDSNGEAMYTVVPGIAVDAGGKSLDLVWELSGETLICGIAEGQEVAYPVNLSVNAVAAYGMEHYFTDYTANADESGYKVSLTPNYNTLYAVTSPAGFSSHKAASWSAVYNHFYTNSWWKNTACMKSQYECHYSCCSSFLDTCETWDLETWRTGTATMSNLCNP